MYVTGKDKPLVNATTIPQAAPLYHHFTETSLIYHYGCSPHRDQCSYKTYKCEFSSYPYAEHNNQQCIPCQPHLIHIPAGLLQGVVIKQDRYAELVKTQQVQRHGTKAKTGEDGRVRERCLVSPVSNNHPQYINEGREGEASPSSTMVKGNVHMIHCRLKEGILFYSLYSMFA